MYRSVAWLIVVFFFATFSGQATLTLRADICITEVVAGSNQVDINATATVSSQTGDSAGLGLYYLDVSAWENSLCIGNFFDLMPGSSSSVEFRTLNAGSSVRLTGPRVPGSCFECYASLATITHVGQIIHEDEEGPVGGDCSTSGCVGAAVTAGGKRLSGSYSPLSTIFCLPESQRHEKSPVTKKRHFGKRGQF